MQFSISTLAWEYLQQTIPAWNMTTDRISLFPFSEGFFFFLNRLLCADCSGAQPEGIFLSGQAACFWNNDLDKNPK